MLSPLLLSSAHAEVTFRLPPIESEIVQGGTSDARDSAYSVRRLEDLASYELMLESTENNRQTLSTDGEALPVLAKQRPAELNKNSNRLDLVASDHVLPRPTALPVMTGLTRQIDLPKFDAGEPEADEQPRKVHSTDALVELREMQSGSEELRWWEAEVGRGLRRTQQQAPISLNSLLVAALSHSAQIQLISDQPLISETEITTADAAFDWTHFVDARWDDVSDPVGSTLTTGGPNRLRDHNATVEMGVRRRNTIGGEFEIGQRLGHQNNNSIFFLPENQGTSRLTLSYTQPLLRGSGRAYNTSLTVLAQLRTKADHRQFEAQLQDHLLSVTREYWGLYFERARHLQNRKLLENGLKVLEELDSREHVDALQSQIVRARAAVENRKAQLVRSRLNIRMAEARIRALVNSPELGETLSVELIPQEQMLVSAVQVELQAAVAMALKQRPEIDAAIQQMKAASVRMNMGKREALPLLNVVLESYASGLEGNSNVGRALREQFAEGEPSYGIGLQYEQPIWNRLASSRVQKRRLELRRLQHQFRQTVETMKLEVELAVHEATAAKEALGAKQRALEAANVEVAYLHDRWQLLPVDNGSASLLLEDLLEAQDRLAESELAVLQSLLDQSLAQVELKRAVGSLLETHQITIDRNCECNLPGQQPVQNRALRYPHVSAELPVEFMSPEPQLVAPVAMPDIQPSTRPIWND